MGRPALSHFPDIYDPIEIAWAAGLFEGEGCIHLVAPRPQSPQRQTVLVVQMCDQEIMQRFARIIGGRVTGPFNPSNNGRFPNAKPFWRWRCASQVYVARFAEVVGPLLGSRKQKLLGLTT